MATQKQPRKPKPFTLPGTITVFDPNSRIRLTGTPISLPKKPPTTKPRDARAL